MFVHLFRGMGWSCVLLVLTACVGSAMAGPTAQEQGDLAEALDKPITANFIGTPMEQALDTIAREVGVNIMIAPGMRQADGRYPVTLRINDLPAAKVLNLIGLASESDWYIEQGVVFFATADYVRSLKIETRVYNISDLMQAVPNYLGPDLSLNGTLSNTSSGGSNARQSESYGSGGGGGGGLFGDDSDLSEETLSRRELIEGITQLIEDTCGTPDEWLDEESTLTELNGNLVVKSTPDVLEQVETLLTQLSDARGRMVGIEGQFFAVPRELLDELDGKLVLNAEELAAFVEKSADGGARRISAARTVCFDGQRVYVYAGHDATLLSDMEPIPNAAGIDPTLSVARNGAVIDVMPTITLDGKSISIAVRTDTVDSAAMRSTGVPVGSAETETEHIRTSGSVDGEQKPRGENPGGNISGTVNQAGTLSGETDLATLGEVDLEMPEHDLLTHRTNVRIPDGGAVILSGVSNMYANVDAQSVELVLILRARIVE